ncbi:AP-3 complex subunit mu-1-like [Symsagittifera roscoffensis]|uniref:AP-3 complex subunit mu-1-like n=1 Tax=Symsagittifera roscoffensis TaxID=84072 RepID=UPI00307C864E
MISDWLKMIHSLFIINGQRDVFMEKHWKSVVNKSICDYFFEELSNGSSADDVQPVIATPHHYLVSIYRDRLYLVAVVTQEVPPLFVIEFLHKVVDTFTEYFDECSETAIKDNYVVVYELLEEMLDNGYPLATESNILQELIKPPNIIRSVVNTVTGKSNVSETLPTGQLSNVPWRRSGVKYTNNEAYFDVVEEIDAIIDKSGGTVSAEITGWIDAAIKLTGMPDLCLNFINPRVLDDVSFHPCVRYKKWEQEKVLSFVPPDGNFRLISYHLSSNNVVAIPMYCRSSVSFKDGSGKLDITIGPKQTMGKLLEDVVITVPFNKVVLTVTLTGNQGATSFDPATKIFTWKVGKIDPQRLTPTLKGNIQFPVGSPIPENPTVMVDFKIHQLATSGLKVNRLDMYNEKYKPFKGVKYLTKAGRFQFRT